MKNLAAVHDINELVGGGGADIPIVDIGEQDSAATVSTATSGPDFDSPVSRLAGDQQPVHASLHSFGASSPAKGSGVSQPGSSGTAGIGGVSGRAPASGPNAGLNLAPTDPLYADQWHFDLMGNGGGRTFIETVWNEFTGAGVNVGVYDSGVQSIHYDLDGNYNSALHVVVGGVTLPGDPDATLEAHGTAVAGIIGAEQGNGAGGVGVAFGSNLTGVNIFDPTSPAFINGFDISGFIEAMMQMANFDVTNHSWGAYPGYFPTESLTALGSFTEQTHAAMEYSVLFGRGGLGTNIVKSAGNDFTDSNGDGLNASRYTITVNALLENGFAAAYSNSGANSLVSAAGGDFDDPPFDGTRRVTTTDLLGADGFGTGDFTDQMNGTSAAAPMVSGVVALMLDANANLGWRDVQNILAMTAFQTGSGLGAAVLGQNEEHFWFENGADNWNGGGMHFSNDYGYGNVDPFGAVRMAEAFGIINADPRTSFNEFSSTTGVMAANLAPVDGQPDQFVTFSFGFGGDLVVEHVQLTLGINHTYIGDLIINLTSAEGTVVNVKAADFGASSSYFFGDTWTFGIDALRGELSAGTWTLAVSDAFAVDTGAVTSVEMTVFGDAGGSINDVFHYTDEYFTLGLSDPSRSTVSDSDGGVDWLNMAAVSSSMTIDLRNGASSVVTIAAGSNIENAIAGDGSDTLIGNSLGNQLFGMRGNDTLTGLGGGDVLNGGKGRDTADYSASSSAVIASLTGSAGIGGHAAGDTLFEIENLIGSNHGDTLIGSIGFNDLFGGTGNDTLIGGKGRDNLFGGDDFDFADYSASAKRVLVSLVTNLGTAGDAKGDVLDSIEGVIGSEANDVVIGSDFNDTLIGGGGADVLNGRLGDDTIEGGGNGDRIAGGRGADTMSGGLGSDAFVYTSKNEGGDNILDFNNVNGDNDWFEFYGVTFGGLAAGNLAVNQFQKSTSDVALTADVRFFFETDTSTLWYDQDGSVGAFAAIAMAIINPGIDIIRNDILIV